MEGVVKTSVTFLYYGISVGTESCNNFVNKEFLNVNEITTSKRRVSDDIF